MVAGGDTWWQVVIGGGTFAKILFRSRSFLKDSEYLFKNDVHKSLGCFLTGLQHFVKNGV